MKTYQTYSSEETKKLGAELARQGLGFRLKVLGKNKRALIYNRTRNKCALILALKGDLGTGKTTFTQGFLKGLGVKGRVSSPTFVLIKTYNLRHMNYNRVHHIDAYRLKKPKELLDLGLKEILEDPKSIALIEWAEKLKRYLPKDAVWVGFKHRAEKEERVIKIP